MESTLTLALSAVIALSASTGEWHKDYAKALQAGKAQDKPVLALFTNDAGKLVNAKFEEMPKSLDAFVLLHADKTTVEGKKLFDLFEIRGDSALVVVDRTQAWQFCRFERDIAGEDLKTVLAGAAAAKGKPTHDLIPVAADAAEAVSHSTTSSYSGATSSYCPSCRRGGR